MIAARKHPPSAGADRARQYPAGLLARRGVPGRDGRRHRRQARRRRAGRRRHADPRAVRHPAPRLRQLRRRRVRDGRRLSAVDRQRRSRPGLLPAAIILEPDALAMADCLSADQRQERFDLIRYAVDTLTRDPAAAVYVDGGALALAERRSPGRPAQPGRRRTRPGLQPQHHELLHHRGGDRLRRGGLRNDQRRALRDRHLPQRRRPGRGHPLELVQSRRPGLGTAPTTETAGPHADAYLWVKRVGESDGSCGRGEPSAGTFVSQYVMELSATPAGRRLRRPR